MLEATDFHPGRSGRDHLLMLAYAADLPASRVDEVLGLVELSQAARRRVGGYSMGMRQRLGLAGALLGDPELLILDEPANGLDPEGVHWLREFLRGFAAEGKTVFVSSHVLAEVAQTVDDVVIINKGKLVTVSPLADLLARSTSGVHVIAPEAERLHDLLRARGHRDVACSSTRTSCSSPARRPAEVGEIAGAAGRLLARALRQHVEPRRHLPRADCEGGVTMLLQLRSELVKLRSTRTNLGLLVRMIGLVLLLVIVYRLGRDVRPSWRRTNTSGPCSGSAWRAASSPR